MYDGHSGIENRQINSIKSGNYSLVLSYLKQGNGLVEFVIHASSKSTYVGGYALQPQDFLANIGFEKYFGQCQFHEEGCYYRVIAKLQKDRQGFENHSHTQEVYRRFTSFADKIVDLYNARQTEYSIISEIGLSAQVRGVLQEPFLIEITEKDIPIWVEQEKFSQLIELEKQNNKTQEEINYYKQFLPLIFATGEALENAVIFSLRFIGLNANKTEKGFTVDVLAETPNQEKKFGLEITGINEAVKKNSRKLTQVMDFERIKEHDEKTILLVNTHNTTPIAERAKLENFTQPVIDFLGRHPILMMTSLDLYRMIKDVLDEKISKESIIESLYTKTGVLRYPETGEAQ